LKVNEEEETDTKGERVRQADKQPATKGRTDRGRKTKANQRTRNILADKETHIEK
jgi:hypothetical protein